MVEQLALFAGLDGALAFILGVFFILSTLTKQDSSPQSATRRLAAFLGVTLIAFGVSNVIVYYTGGLGPYLERGGSKAVGIAALVARGIAGVGLFVLIIDSLLIWRRARQKIERNRT